MDTNHFDSLAKVVGAWTTRRSALALLTGLGLGSLDPADAEARKSGTCQPQCIECNTCKKGKCKKKNGKKRCKKGKCTPKANGTTCTAPAGGTCQNSTCVCTGGTTNCGGVCSNLQTDEAHCGACGAVCTANQVCQAGSCFPRSTCPATTTGFCNLPDGTACGTPGCSCSLSAEGNVVCISFPPPRFCDSLTPCTSSATCPAGSACVEIGSCCVGEPAHTCFPRCPTPTAAGVTAARGGRLLE